MWLQVPKAVKVAVPNEKERKVSNKTLYFCDKCKKEVDNSKVLTNIKIELDPYSSYKTKKFDRVSQHYELCEECTEKLGFTLRKIVEEKPIVESTTADKLYDILTQMIQENQP